MNPAIRTTDITRLTGGVDVYTPVIGGGGGGATIVNDFVSDTNDTKGVYVITQGTTSSIPAPPQGPSLTHHKTR
jgi:hypothetical protein